MSRGILQSCFQRPGSACNGRLSMRDRVALGVSLLLIGVVAACGSPPAPTQPATQPPVPAPSRLTISGPSSVALNQTAAFTATETFSDGSTQDVTARIQWLAGAPDILTVTGPGQATGHRSGETSLRTSLSGLYATLNVLVLPSGTFRLIGTVSEGTFPLANVSVTVISGTGAGLTGQTDLNGQYRLYGVAGDIQIRATSVGFSDGTVNTTVTANAVQDISLTTVNPEPSIAGTYAMTLDAGPTCPLPNEEMERHYTATITQSGATFKVALSGATFLTANGLGSSFLGRVLAGQISYQIQNGADYYDGYSSPYPDFVESIADGRVLVVIGSGVLVQSGPNLTGTLIGSLIVDTPPLWSAPINAQCYSNQHRVLLTTQASAAHRIRH
jgi:hypothetical protein